MNKKQCLAFIKEFIEEELDNNLNQLINFDFKMIKNKRKYSGSEPDNTKIANAIYAVVYGDAFSDLTYANLGRGKKYRGDVINSFRTMFGKPYNQDLKLIDENKVFKINEIKTFVGINKFQNNQEVINQAKVYYQKYHTIGNMVPIPNLAYQENNIIYNINRVKGLGSFNDYMDYFLGIIKPYFVARIRVQIQDEPLKKLLKINDDFFEKYKGLEGFKTFINDFYLNDYVDNDYNVLVLFAPHLHWYHFDKTKVEEYNQAALNYVKVATQIINNRAQKIIKKIEIEFNK